MPPASDHADDSPPTMPRWVNSHPRCMSRHQSVGSVQSRRFWLSPLGGLTSRDDRTVRSAYLVMEPAASYIVVANALLLKRVKMTESATAVLS